MKQFDQDTWDAYREKELPALIPLLASEGVSIADEPLLRGVYAVPEKPALTLLGTRTEDGKRVVVHVTSDPDTAKDLEGTHRRRECIERYECLPSSIHLPEELAFGRRDMHTFMVTKFLYEDRSFSELSLEEGFFFALRVLEAQEQAPALSYRATRDAHKLLDTFSAQRYVNTVQQYRRSVTKLLPEHTQAQEVLALAGAALLRERERIDRYSGALLYHRASPETVRVSGGEMYLLDPALFRFGNRYESWAHFVDHAALHQPELESALTTYIRENRGEEVSETLRLMRLYTLAEVIHRDARARQRVATEKAVELDTRIDFWTAVLQTQLTAG